MEYSYTSNTFQEYIDQVIYIPSIFSNFLFPFYKVSGIEGKKNILINDLDTIKQQIAQALLLLNRPDVVVLKDLEARCLQCHINFIDSQMKLLNYKRRFHHRLCK